MTTDESNNIVVDDQKPSWFIDDNIPGVGERPGWLPEKFKTVADMAKSNAELEKRLGTVPDNYDFKKSKFLDPDYEPFQELQAVAKEKRVPQEFVDKMIESIDKFVSEFSTDPAEEFKQLGDNAQERVKVLDNWAKANLSETSYIALTSRLTNAESIKALEELRGKMMSNVTQIPPNGGGVNTSVSLEDLRMELSTNLEKYKTDKPYRDDLSKRMEIASKSAGGYVDKVGS